MSSEIYQLIGERIRMARQGRFSQSALAAQLGFSQGAISKYERAEREVSIPDLMRIAAVLGKPVSYFLGETPLLGPHDALGASMEQVGFRMVPLYNEMSEPGTILREAPAHYVPLPHYLLEDADYALRVDASASYDPDIRAGDTVLIRRQAYAKQGDYILTFHPETGYAITRYRGDEDWVPSTRPQIVGRVLRLVRDF